MDLNQMLDHLSGVSVFGHSALALFVILGIDCAITLAHTLEEWKSREVPLWRNFGAIVGVWVPDWLGFPVFILGLTAGLWAVGLMGISGSLPNGPVRNELAAVALGALVGARVADTLISHVLLYRLGYQPNPGLYSTTLYVAEALFLIATFNRGLTAGGALTWRGLECSTGFFCIVLPSLWTLRIVPGWRKDRWHHGTKIPPWTKGGLGATRIAQPHGHG
jgi:hypothetical protein